MKTLNFIIFLCILSFFSCNNVKKEKEKQITQLVNEWQGKQIFFPKNLIFTHYLTDTIDLEIPESEYKILIYVDSIGCTSCKLQLYKWKKFIEYTDSVTKGNVPFLFIFHLNDYNEIHYLLKRDNFNYPICFDLDDQLNKLNKFPADTNFQTFLLDKDNKVSVLGNPIHNTAVKDLYLKQITSKDNLNNTPKTTAEVIQTDINFGSFDKSEIKEAIIEIKNIGDNPLVIVDTSTTCGCTIVTYEKQPVPSGKQVGLRIKMIPKAKGFFNEVVTIKYNSLNNQPIKLKIKGNVQ
ncbi:DUF1573 domain-containing protein [uncultured Parabacteroides sp.]|uniref:DUF1573 domain-containing protein n=1 Tax=uncultured Parabacteroides sp. TaxID=512312 RepID=UPI0025952CA9|nr:DUF1573 domain-containing protein [uncultured Parabacteroides sp.]